jgi:hypothetical protein
MESVNDSRCTVHDFEPETLRCRRCALKANSPEGAAYLLRGWRTQDVVIQQLTKNLDAWKGAHAYVLRLHRFQVRLLTAMLLASLLGYAVTFYRVATTF